MSRRPRSGLVKKPGRNGPGGGFSGIRRAMRTTARRCCAASAPSARRPPRPPRMPSAPTWPQGNQRADGLGRLDADLAAARSGEPGGSTSTTTTPDGRSSAADPSAAGAPGPRRCRCCRRAAAPCASGPARGTSSKMHPSIARRPCRRARAMAAGERSTPSAQTPLRASASRRRPGPQPTSSAGPVTRGRDLLVGGRVHAEPAPNAAAGAASRPRGGRPRPTVLRATARTWLPGALITGRVSVRRWRLLQP